MMKTNYNLGPLMEAAESYLSACARYERMFHIFPIPEQEEAHRLEIVRRRSVQQCTFRMLLTMCDMVNVDFDRLLSMVRSMARHYRKRGAHYRRAWFPLAGHHTAAIKRYLAE